MLANQSVPILSLEVAVSSLVQEGMWWKIRQRGFVLGWTGRTWPFCKGTIIITVYRSVSFLKEESYKPLPGVGKRKSGSPSSNLQDTALTCTTLHAPGLKSVWCQALGHELDWFSPHFLLRKHLASSFLGSTQVNCHLSICFPTSKFVSIFTHI